MEEQIVDPPTYVFLMGKILLFIKSKTTKNVNILVIFLSPLSACSFLSQISIDQNLF